MITVFYDGKCGLCSSEIKYYQKIDRKGVFNWADANEHLNDLKERGMSLSDALMYLHAVDDQEQFHIGVDAFILIWKHLPKWRWLSVFTRMPVVYHLANFVYRIFAKWRFNRLSHCQVSLTL